MKRLNVFFRLKDVNFAVPLSLIGVPNQHYQRSKRLAWLPMDCTRWQAVMLDKHREGKSKCFAAGELGRRPFSVNRCRVKCTAGQDYASPRRLKGNQHFQIQVLPAYRQRPVLCV